MRVHSKARLCACTVHLWHIFFVTCKWGGSCSIYVRWGHSVFAARWFWSGLQTCQEHHSGVSSWHWRSWKKSGAGKRYVCVCVEKKEHPREEMKGRMTLKPLRTFSSGCLCTFLLFNLKYTCELPTAPRQLSSSQLKQLRRRCSTANTEKSKPCSIFREHRTSKSCLHFQILYQTILPIIWNPKWL